MEEPESYQSVRGHQALGEARSQPTWSTVQLRLAIFKAMVKAASCPVRPVDAEAFAEAAIQAANKLAGRAP